MMAPISPVSPPPERLSVDPKLEIILRDGGVNELTESRVS
jgi:hypothetical protein